MKKTKIDWADSSWNPITGCLNDCPYCYARKIANRFNKEGFDPTFHKSRLLQPQGVKKSENIFVCSMADLFGDWIPDHWIRQVFEACKAAPQHNYIFLTKNPDRYVDLLDKGIMQHEENYWYGSTMTTPEALLYQNPNIQTFASLEPILDSWPVSKLVVLANKVDWIIVGSETGNRKDKVIPNSGWIKAIKHVCKGIGTPLFMKASLKELMGEDFVQEYPEKLRKS